MKRIILFAVLCVLVISAFSLALNFPQSEAAPEDPAAAPSLAFAQLPTVLPPTTYNLQPLSVPILVYHHIGTPGPSIKKTDKSFFIEPDWLERHLQYLQQNNYETIKFEDIAAYFETGTPLPITDGAKPVIISFDDGFKSTFERAFPLLEKYGMTATIFIPVNLVGMGRGQGSRMTWKEIALLQAAGWEIGSHTLWHPYLTKSKKARIEIFESKRVLEEKLDGQTTVFAYPYGDYNARIETLVKEAGYRISRSFSEKGRGGGITAENLFHVPVVRVWGNLELPVFLK